MFTLVIIPVILYGTVSKGKLLFSCYLISKEYHVLLLLNYFLLLIIVILKDIYLPIRKVGTKLLK